MFASFQNQMLAGIDSFIIVLLIAAGSAFFNWLKKREESPDEWQQPTLPPHAPPGKPSAPQPPPIKRNGVDWEAELRRMLDMESPASSPPRPSIGHPQAPPPTPPIPRPPASARAQATHRVSAPAPASARVLHAPVPARSEQDLDLTMKTWGGSGVAYDRASQIGQHVAAHIRQVTTHPVGSTFVESFKVRSPEIQRALSFFSNSRTMRQVVIASVLLGPPKALESPGSS